MARRVTTGHNGSRLTDKLLVGAVMVSTMIAKMDGGFDYGVAHSSKVLQKLAELGDCFFKPWVLAKRKQQRSRAAAASDSEEEDYARARKGRQSRRKAAASESESEDDGLRAASCGACRAPWKSSATACRRTWT